MASDPLATLLRLRQTELDDASAAVVEALHAETAADAVRHAAEQLIADETRLAARSDADTDVERFANWLKRARTSLRKAEQAMLDATELTSVRRAELALVRAAAKATEDALERRRLSEQQYRDRLAQRDQDEIGQRRAEG